MSETIRTLVVGCGSMGASHARAYHKMDAFEVAGLVAPTPKRREKLAAELGGVAQFDSFDKALDSTRPDAVSINTYPDTHAEYSIKAMRAGAHVFAEKPLAQTAEDAEEVVRVARETERKLVIGYILRVHPAWQKFTEIAQTLGKPLVMRMNLNQQSKGEDWTWHKNLLNALPAMVDCGVHYVDVMCQMTRAKPIRVHGIGALLSDELNKDTYNYGQLQVVFDDGSVGWYEAGWGPMMSEVAYFVKDVVGPKGCVSIVHADPGAAGDGHSADIDSHTATNCLRVHHAAMGADGKPIKPDEIIDTSDEPDHQELCDREQAYFLKAIREDLDLTDHMEDAVNSLRIVLAADKSVRTGQVVDI